MGSLIGFLVGPVFFLILALKERALAKNGDMEAVWSWGFYSGMFVASLIVAIFEQFR